MPWWLMFACNWLFYYRRGKIKYNVYQMENGYEAAASNGRITVLNCYGSTPEAAKEMARFRLNQATKEIKETYFIINGEKHPAIISGGAPNSTE